MSNTTSITATETYVRVVRRSGRLVMPLHSPLYEARSTPISILIFDELQTAKSPDSLINCEVQSLTHKYVFLLSGTPVYHAWDDIYEQMALLPGCPLTGMSHFQLWLSRRVAVGEYRGFEISTSTDSVSCVLASVLYLSLGRGGPE